MNERILELAKHAGFDNGHQDRNGNSLSYELEKFAELIMAECFGVLQKRFMGDWNREDQEVLRCIEDIRKHFGVEE